MIHSFFCKNFYSFSEDTTVSFVVNNNAPDNNGYFKTPLGVRLSKAETVIGANASGKTNLLKILPFLKWLIIDSFNSKPDAPIWIQPFAFGDYKDKPSELSVVFETNDKIYNYCFSLTKERILKEELKATSFAKEKLSTKKIFSREWNDKTKKYDFDSDNFELPKEFEELLRSNSSAIGTAARLNHIESQAIAKYWSQMETNVIEAGWIGDHSLLNASIQFHETANFYNSNKALKEEAEKLLRHFDLGLDGIEITKAIKDNGTSMSIKGIHLFDGEKQFLPIQYESSGTKQLFVLLKSILVALEKGSMVVLDEFECNLHPEIVMALYDLFIQPETNPKNAQLFMSTHSHIVLSKLDKYQIVLVEKDGNGISDTWRLDEMPDSRSDDNYYAKYIAGAYGAVPKI